MTITASAITFRIYRDISKRNNYIVVDRVILLEFCSISVNENCARKLHAVHGCCGLEQLESPVKLTLMLWSSSRVSHS